MWNLNFENIRIRLQRRAAMERMENKWNTHMCFLNFHCNFSFRIKPYNFLNTNFKKYFFVTTICWIFFLWSHIIIIEAKTKGKFFSYANHITPFEQNSFEAMFFLNRKLILVFNASILLLCAIAYNLQRCYTE